MSDHIVRQVAWRGTFAFVCLVALLRGRAPERLTVGILITADLLTALPLRIGPWKPVELSLVLIDLCVAAFFVGLALISSRWWPLWAAAFHLLALIMLFVNALDPTIRPYAYYVGELTWDYFGLIALLFGTLFEARRNLSRPAARQTSSNPSAR